MRRPDIHTTTVVDRRSRSAIKNCWACTVPSAFDVMISYLSQDDKCLNMDLLFQIRIMAHFETEVYKLLMFWLVQAINMTTSSVNGLGPPKLVYAHDSALSLTNFKRFSRQDSQSYSFSGNIFLKWNHFLCWIKTERFASCTTPSARDFATVLWDKWYRIVGHMFCKCDEMS